MVREHPKLFTEVVYPVLEALLEARMEVQKFLQEKADQAVYVRRPAEEQGR